MSEQVELYKERFRKEWARAAPVWRRRRFEWTALSHYVGQELIEIAGIKTGMHVLDLAGGVGAPALAVAERVGPTGQVISTDLVPEVLAIAAETASEQNLTWLTTRPADAEDLPFDDGIFDAITCLHGIMYFPNPGRALAEARRVLKPGGRAAFAVWGPFESGTWFPSTIGVLAKYSTPEPLKPGEPGTFRFAQTGDLATAMKAAGFADIHEENRSLPWVFSGAPAACWQFIQESTVRFRALVDGLSDEDRTQAIEEMVEEIDRFYDGKQVEFTANVNLASGMRED